MPNETVKGFNINGTVVKYDYNSLENKLELDNTLSVANAAADSKTVGDALSEIESDIGLSDDIKTALLNCFEHVAWVDEHGQDYYDDLYDALYPSAELLYIDAVITQGSTVVYPDTSLDSLRSMITVTGYYDDNTSEIVTNYTLSGNLSVGNSDVTVTYNGKTDVVTVVVTARPELDSITAVFNQGQTVVYDTDSLDVLRPMLTVTANYSDSTTETVSNYTLSGTLATGTSTITVSYGGKTTTFDVVVTARFVPIYTLENQNFNNNRFIVPNYRPFNDGDADITICVDINFSTMPTTGNGSTVKIVSITNEDGTQFSVGFGKGTAADNNYTIYYMSQGFSTNWATSTGRLRLVLTHTNGSGNLNVAIRQGNGVKQTQSVSRTFATTSKLVGIGGAASGVQALPTGTLNRAVVYDTVISSDYIDAFLGL